MAFDSVKTLLFKFLALIILSLSVIGGWAWMNIDTELNVTPMLSSPIVDLEIKSGQNFYQLTEQLHQQGIAPAPVWNRLIAWKHPELTQIKVAEYELKQGMSYGDILKLLTTGQGKQYSIRFLEGWTLQQFIHEISNNRTLEKDIELTAHAISDLLNISPQLAEGWLFPDTYQYPKASKVSNLLKLMHQRMQHELNNAWLSRAVDVNLDSAYELLIMASIIEKESALAEERSIISGVFNRRLAKGMRLQTDPTVIYGMGEAYEGNIRRKDLKQMTPYNTYRINGLPPTPIAMPSLGSLKAAAHPAAGSSLYFVSRGDGSHVFSDTLEQHTKAVRKYQIKSGGR